MNVCLFGATGRVGSIILEKALANRHSVRALVRKPENIDKNQKHLTVIEGNVLDKSDVAETMKNSDVVISALNTDGTNTLSASMPVIINNMKAEKITRIITIGTAGILQARSEPVLYRFQSSESKRKSTRDAEEHVRAYLMLKESDLDWTIVCPTYLPLGERKEVYRFERDFLPENPSSISCYDTADFAYQQLFTNEFIGYRVGLTY